MSMNFEEHGYKQVSPGGFFCFDCSSCGDCCRNVKDSVMVEALDLYRLARFHGLEMSEVATQYTNTAFLVPGFPVLILKTKQHMDICIFLKSSRCSVYEARPRPCRTYPLGVGPDDEQPGEWLHFIVSKKKHHFNGQRRGVTDWVNENMTQEDREFVEADFTYTGEIAGLMKKLESRHEEQVAELILYYKYFAYDMSEDFLPQYEKNMEQLKQQLQSLGNR